MAASPRRSASTGRARACDTRQDLGADACGVALLEVDADGARPDVDPCDAEVEDLLEALGALLRRPDDPEAVDECGVHRIARIEVELPGDAPGGALDAALARAQDGLHRVQRLRDRPLVVRGDLREGGALEAGEARVGHDQAA